MRIEFLGTGAADWSEDLRGTEGYRRFSSVLLDGDLLIDPGPHIFSYEEDFGRGDLFWDVENILLTHTHEDHLSLESLRRLCAARERDFRCAYPVIREVPKGLNVHGMELFEPVRIADYRVTTVPANHTGKNAGEQAVHYMIEKENSRLFYGCDGAWLPTATWRFLRKFTFDLMVLDGTLGDVHGDDRIFEHNTLAMAEMMAESFRSAGLLKNGGRIMISHLSRGTHGTQSQVEERLRAADIGVARDGYAAEL